MNEVYYIRYVDVILNLIRLAGDYVSEEVRILRFSMRSFMEVFS